MAIIIKEQRTEDVDIGNLILLHTASLLHEGVIEFIFPQHGMPLGKSDVILEYEDTEFIPYRLHIDFPTVYLLNNSTSGYEQLIQILHQRENNL